MTATLILLLAFGLAALVAVIPFWRRRRLLSRPISQEWRQIVCASLPCYMVMTAQEQERLWQLIVLFLHDKHFHGCQGLEIDDEIRLTIACHACLLLLKRPFSMYQSVRHVLVYPDAFLVRHEAWHEDGTMHAAEQELAGESWDQGKVILSWRDIQEGIADFSDGHNVVLHEFAHQLDGMSGEVNGTPPLQGLDQNRWRQAFEHAFASLQAQAEAGEDSLLDPYGASNPAEFFAVATEAFFEQSHDLAHQYPDLFEQLLAFYRIDPRVWHQRLTASL